MSEAESAARCSARGVVVEGARCRESAPSRAIGASMRRSYQPGLAGPTHTHPLECIGTHSVHFPCIEIRRAARPPQKGQNGYLAVRPGWRPSGVIAEARNARPSMSDMPWLGPARLPPSRSPRSIRPPRSVGAVERASEANWRFFRRRASAQPVRLSPSQGKPPPSLS